MDVIEDVEPDAALRDQYMVISPSPRQDNNERAISSLAVRPLLQSARLCTDGAAETARARERIGKRALENMVTQRWQCIKTE